MQVLRDLGLNKGDRIAFNLPNIPEQIFYMLAAQRMGVVYTPVFGGFSAKTLSDRIHDAGQSLSSPLTAAIETPRSSGTRNLR